MAATPEPHADRVARLTREHAARIAKLKADGAADVKRIHNTLKRDLTEWDLQQQHRREEARVRRQTDDARTIAYRRTSWQRRRGYKLPVTVTEAQHHLADLVETDAFYATDPKVLALAAWVRDVAAREWIEVREDAAPQLRNGDAVRKLRTITIAPIQSLETAVTAAHELGHILGDVNPDAPWKPGEFGLGRICVDDELTAWRWVLAHIPIWELAMHQRMTDCLGSYRPHATEDEARQMTALCGQIEFKQTMLRISMSR